VSDLSTADPDADAATPEPPGSAGGSGDQPDGDLARDEHADDDGDAATPEPAGGADGPGDEADEGGDDEEEAAGGLSWARALVLAAALAFLGFAVGVFVSRDTPPGDDSVDVGFYRDMVVHHQQALGLSALELAYGEDMTVRTFAREVLTFQSYEVGVMSQTLSDWGLTPGHPSGEAMGWMGMPTPVEQMSGLVSEDQLDEMRAARGREADALFLELMAEHHRGGLHMAEYAAEHAGGDDVRELAGRMVRNQAQEINEYRVAADREGYDITIAPADVPE
jgi:uncharacterized protein (DUF305 family)